MIVDIPGSGTLDIRTVILDLNGTISVKGAIVDGVAVRIASLREQGMKIVLFTGNTRGDADDICSSLGIEWKQAKNAEEKAALAVEIGAETSVAIGNGLIDAELMKVVKLGIVTLQSEGVHVQTLLSSDVIVPTINDALDLLLDTQTLIATLRK